jgi:hypothetical protein
MLAVAAAQRCPGQEGEKLSGRAVQRQNSKDKTAQPAHKGVTRAITVAVAA